MTTAAMPAATARLAPAPAHAPAPLPHSAQTFGGLGGLGGRAVSDVPRNPDSPSRRSHHTSISSRPSSYQVQAQAQARAQAQTQVQAQLSQPQSPFSSPHLHSQPHSAAFESAHLDYRQLISSSNYNHSTSHYQSTNARNQSHGGAAQHHHHQHRPYPEQPYRQQQDQPQQLNNHRRTQPSTRPIHEVLPHDDYETSQLARNPSQSHPRPGAASRDRPPVSSRAYHPETSRQYNRSIGKPDTNPNNNHNYRPQLQNYSSDLEQPDMAPSATHGGHSGGDGTQHSSSTKQSRSRTTIPTQSGKWILGKTIGAGSMGKVKLARKEDGSEQVACKIIPRGSTDDGHQSRADKERADQSKEVRTAREAAIVTLLNHPHICGLRDVVRTNYHWYMLFEYVNGGQMLDYIISHGKLKEKQARKFSRQIASALDYCHRNSIVHRDLKIENILISKNGDIKIIDFGLSNLFEPRNHLKTFCGSLYFAAPELLQARAYTGPEVDVWSFGIVLYVLVCGRVPFDDQSMPALHAKIKKGIVDYPNWLSSDCKHLISRMLVTDPKQRASMAEVMMHPWMLKGFSGPPENHLAMRDMLKLPLEPEVIHAMQGFNFGSPESIRAKLTRIIESEEYQRACRIWQRERDAAPPIKDAEKKRPFGLDFYKRRNSQHSRDTLTAPSSEALALGNDPLNAFSPLLSIYYLVKEKQDRDRTDMVPPPTAVARDKEKEKEKERERGKEKEREKEREKEKEREQRERERERERDRDRDERHREPRTPRDKSSGRLPDISPPQAAHTNATAYEMPGEKPTGGRSRPRARTHGEDDAPESAKPTLAPPPEPKSEPKKEGTAAGILRRFSTRKRREPAERSERDRSHPPMVQVHSPSDSANLGPRKSFSIRRGRRDRDETGETRLRSGSSQPQHGDLLSPPLSAGGPSSRRTGGLGRSTSVNSADIRRRDSKRLAKEPPPNSGSDQSIVAEEPNMGGRGHSHSRSVSMRAKSLGHARRESIQQRRMRRGQAQEGNVPEETDMDHEASGVSTDRLDSSDLAKPVFLKGLFSVSTTSGKSVPTIRADIRRVLRQLNVDYTEIKGGFACRHAPSIDLNKVQDPPMSPGQSKRRISFGGMRRGDEDHRDSDRDRDRPPTTPRTPGRSDRDRSYSNSETSVDSIPRRNNGASRRAPGETSTQIQSDLGGNMVLEFEIFIVKVPLLSLHGIQFKRMAGNTWQFKSMADQILKELRL